MIPKDTYVKLLLINGSLHITEEGYVVSWNDDFVQLKDQNDNYCIITRPEDIAIIKIMNKTNKEIKSELEENFQQVYEEHHDPSDDVRNKKLAELKILLNKQEKKIIAEKLKDHVPTSMPTNEKYESRYGTPGLFKK